MSDLKPKDLRIDTFTGGPRSPIVMRITHIPTGLTVEGEYGSRMKLRAFLMGRLTKRVETWNQRTDARRKCSQADEDQNRLDDHSLPSHALTCCAFVCSKSMSYLRWNVSTPLFSPCCSRWCVLQSGDTSRHVPFLRVGLWAHSVGYRKHTMHGWRLLHSTNSGLWNWRANRSFAFWALVVTRWTRRVWQKRHP